VSQNGRDLAALLEQLVAAAPRPVEEISLIGHSLGGLVIRSACHYAQELGLTWVPRVRRAIYLGTPHLGSPFEKAGHLISIALGAIDDPVVRLVHALTDLRGAGVKDLRHGSLLDEDWMITGSGGAVARRPRELPLHSGMEHYFVASTLTRNAKHWAALLLGDALVRVPSATGPGHRARLAAEHIAVLPGLSHMQLSRSPEVYARIRLWFGEAGAAQEHAAVPARARVPTETGGIDPEQLDAYRALVQDAVDRGATAIQEIQETLTARPYDVLERVPGLSAPAEVVRSLHEKSVQATYDTIRLVNRGVGALLSAGISGWKAVTRERGV
jgi:pimeloyl-ACP methyl ester carboxylesterase